MSYLPPPPPKSESASNTDNLQNTQNVLNALLQTPQWFKYFFGVLNVVLAAFFIAALVLHFSVKDEHFAGEVVFKQSEGLTHNAQIAFTRYDLPQRSRNISTITMESILWIPQINPEEINDFQLINHNIYFTGSKNINKVVSLQKDQKIGDITYKISLAPLIKRLAAAFLLAIFVLFYSPILRRFFALLPKKTLATISLKLLPKVILNSYKAINPLYRHTFWIVFIAMNLVFGFHTVQYLWGGECWQAIFWQMDKWITIAQGRYTQNTFNLWLQNNYILPVLNNLISFASLALASVWLCIYFNLQKKLWVWVIVGFVLTLQPFTLARLYYTYQAAGLFIAVAIGILGFVLAKKAGDENKSKSSAYWLCFIATFCIHWGIASYQPFIDTALILLCGGIIVILIDEKCSVKTAIFKARFVIIATLLAALSYKLALDALKLIGIAGQAYNNQMISMAEMPARFLLAMQRGFATLFAYKVPFMELNIAFLFSLFVVFLFFLFCNAKLKISAKFAIVLAGIGAVFASQTHVALASFLSTNIVTDYYGILFVRVLVVALVFKLCDSLIHTKTLVYNAVFALSVITLWQCIVQDLQIQKVQKLTMEKDFAYLNRVIARIENHENFDYNKKYTGLMFGKPINNYTQPFIDNILAIGTTPFNVMMAKDVFSRFLNDNYTNKDFENLIKRLSSAGILEKLEPFPHKNSIVVFEDMIVFVASEGDLRKWQNEAKKWQEQP